MRPGRARLAARGRILGVATALLLLLVGAGCGKTGTTTTTQALLAPAGSSTSVQPTATSEITPSSLTQPSTTQLSTTTLRSTTTTHRPTTTTHRPTTTTHRPTTTTHRPTTTTHQPTTTTSRPAGPVLITISGFAFEPASVTIHVGQKVIWTNNDSVQHTVTADNGAFGSAPIDPGGRFSHAFTSAGTFSYICSIHPQMHGVVIVQ